MDGVGRLTEQAIVTDCLNSEKYAASMAGTAVLESASPFVKRDFESIGRDCTQNAEIIFRLMSNRGWYNVQSASQQAASQAQQQASTVLDGITGSVTPGVTMSVGQTGWGGYQAGRSGGQAGAGYSPSTTSGGQLGAYGSQGTGFAPGAGFRAGGGPGSYGGSSMLSNFGSQVNPQVRQTPGSEIIAGRGPSSTTAAGTSRRKSSTQLS